MQTIHKIRDHKEQLSNLACNWTGICVICDFLDHTLHLQFGNLKYSGHVNYNIGGIGTN